MLKTVALSQANKTAGCAVTYRAGAVERFGTCPKTCELNPCADKSTNKIEVLAASRPWFKTYQPAP
jgi:hypothetical protein